MHSFQAGSQKCVSHLDRGSNYITREYLQVPSGAAARACRDKSRTSTFFIITPRNRRIPHRSAYHRLALEQILLLVNLFVQLCRSVIFVDKNRQKIDGRGTGTFAGAPVARCTAARARLEPLSRDESWNSQERFASPSLRLLARR